MSTDSARIASERSSARLGDLAVLDAGVRLELERGDDRAGVNLDDGPRDRELAALLLEQPRRLHQLAFVDLPLGARGIEQRRRAGRRTRRACVSAGDLLAASLAGVGVTGGATP